MKKLFVLASCAVMSVTALSAQWSYGIKAGLNLSNITNTNLSLDEIGLAGKLKSKIKPGFYVGGFAEYRIDDLLAIQPEAIYSRQGNKYSELGTMAWYKMDYINIPILVKFYLSERISFDVGPQLGFLVNSEYKVKEDGETYSEDLKHLTESFDFSLAFGFTGKITSRIEASARYNLGMTKLWEPTGNRDNPKNSVFQIGLGYKF